MDDKTKKLISKIQLALDDIKHINKNIEQIVYVVDAIEDSVEGLDTSITINVLNKLVDVSALDLTSFLKDRADELEQELRNKTKTLKTYNLIVNGEPIDEAN